MAHLAHHSLLDHRAWHHRRTRVVVAAPGRRAQLQVGLPLEVFEVFDALAGVDKVVAAHVYQDAGTATLWLKEPCDALEATGTGPALPAELAADTSSLGVVAQAVWLSGHDGGRWRLESFERLRPLIRAGDPLAGTIGDGVLWGESAR